MLCWLQNFFKKVCALSMGCDAAQVELNSKSFGEHFERALAGDVQAMVNLGLCYEAGRGVSKNEKEGIGWYISAAEKGNPLAQMLLCSRYADGHNVERNAFLACFWGELCVINSNDDVFRAAAQKRLSNIVLTKPEQLTIAFNLGICLANGHRVINRDVERAKAYLSIASELPDGSAEFNLGCLESEAGNVIAAADYWLQAAKKSYVPAINSLGVMVERGIHFESDAIKAYAHFLLCRRLAVDSNSIYETAEWNDNASRLESRLTQEERRRAEDVSRAIEFVFSNGK